MNDTDGDLHKLVEDYAAANEWGAEFESESDE